MSDEFICCESTTLKNWLVKVGENLTDDTPRKIRGGQKNHLCVLTTKYPNTPEENFAKEFLKHYQYK